jgi:hypothetical protein
MSNTAPKLTPAELLRQLCNLSPAEILEMVELLGPSQIAVELHNLLIELNR